MSFPLVCMACGNRGVVAKIDPDLVCGTCHSPDIDLDQGQQVTALQTTALDWRDVFSVTPAGRDDQWQVKRDSDGKVLHVGSQEEATAWAESHANDDSALHSESALQVEAEGRVFENAYTKMWDHIHNDHKITANGPGYEDHDKLTSYHDGIHAAKEWDHHHIIGTTASLGQRKAAKIREISHGVLSTNPGMGAEEALRVATSTVERFPRLYLTAADALNIAVNKDYSQGWARRHPKDHPRAGQPEHWGVYETGENEKVHLYRGKNNRTRFYNETGKQVGPEQSNVAPAMAYAADAGWRDHETKMPMSARAVLEHLAAEELVCDKCGAVFEDSASRDSHVADKHPDSADAKDSPPGQDKKLDEKPKTGDDKKGDTPPPFLDKDKAEEADKGDKPDEKKDEKAS